MDKHVDDSCDQRAECFHHSLIIVHTECGQWYMHLSQRKNRLTHKVIATEMLVCDVVSKN